MQLLITCFLQRTRATERCTVNSLSECPFALAGRACQGGMRALLARCCDGGAHRSPSRSALGLAADSVAEGPAQAARRLPQEYKQPG